MKKKSLITLIGIIIILAACSEEKTDKDSENQIKEDTINSTYRGENISISISIRQERYDQGEAPVVIIRNDGETSVDYTGLGTSLEYLQDNVWVAVDSDAVGLDELNVLEPGQKMEQKFPPSSILQEGIYRVVFIFNANSNEEKNSKRVAVSFYVD